MMRPQEPHPVTAQHDPGAELHGELNPRGQSAALELLARGEPRVAVLSQIARTIEEQLPGVLCSILVLDHDTQRLRHGAAPSLPTEYNDAIDGVVIGDDVGSCGTAAFRGERIVVADISTDPLWANYRGIALKYDLRSCWSQPVFSTSGQVIGTFAMYYRVCNTPAPLEIRLIEKAANLAGVAIEHTHNAALLRRAHEDLEDRVQARTAELRAANRHLEQEIADREKVEHALQLAQFSVEHSVEAAFWLQSNGQFQYVNHAACCLLGYTRAELLALSVPDIDTRISGEQWPATWALVRRTGGTTLETTLLAKGGAEVPVEVSVSYLEFGGQEYHCAYARDISERKRTEAEHAALEDQLRHAQKLKAVGELAGGVAHEFNNLLLIIGEGVTRARKLARANPVLSDALGLIAQAASDAEGVTRSLLTFGHRVEVNRRPIELGELVREICQLLQSMFPASIEQRIDTAGSPPLYVEGDSTQLRQIVMNLAINARDAMPDGGRLAITVRPAIHADWQGIGMAPHSSRSFVSLVVADTGCGMDEEKQSRVFEPFFTTKTRTSGTGLGLAVVHGIVRDHEGCITVRSEVGRGSTFIVILPCVDPPAAVLPDKATPS
jgi:PAS domain S-box-containing protein